LEDGVLKKTEILFPTVLGIAFLSIVLSFVVGSGPLFLSLDYFLPVAA
jgi:hypothetical protein